METFQAETKNIKTITRVVAILVLANFVILAVVIGPDSVGYDPTYGPIQSIINFLIGFLTTGILMGIYVVFEVKKTFDLSHAHNILFVCVTVQMLFALGPLVTYNSVFENVIDASTVGAVSSSFNTAIFFLYGFYVFLLVSNDKKRNNLLSNRTQIVGNLFAAIIIPVSILSLVGLIPAAAWGALFILGGVILYPLFIIGVGDAIGNYSKD